MSVKYKHKGLVFEGCGRKNEATYYMYTSMCKGCGLCIVKCPVNAQGKKCLQWSKEVGVYATPAVQPDPELCVACGMCETICPDRAIRIEK